MVTHRNIAILLVLSIAFNVCFASKCTDELDMNKRRLEGGVLDAVGPECDHNGDYTKVQCILNGCYCVDVKTGEALGEVIPWGEPHPVCN
ncbi:hypothetical protein B4U80_11882 [Leptotrombidium deliense]|uniref:Thyroglobulin type-1 domain-containing protein n=1 Tax=Leptotrombidium deliense TaxID=299467 RepID=A0A443S1A3_9ACAR|nr:hypothetical protein B4U80_11882 [Leptotrombidium deliense]